MPPANGRLAWRAPPLVKLNVRSWGDAAAPRSAVLIHDITSNSGSWERTAEALVETGYHCVAPDLRGHGASPKPSDAGITLDEMVADLGESIPRDPDLLVGHSLGGALALLAVTDGVLAPKALVLEDPLVYLPDKTRPQQLLAAVEAGPRDAAGIQAANPRWDPGDVEEKVGALQAIEWHHMRQILVDNAPWDLRPRIRDLARRVPALFVLADPSDFVPPSEARIVEATLGPRSVAVVPGAGHSVHRDDLEGFLGTMLTWLEAARAAA